MSFDSCSLNIYTPRFKTVQNTCSSNIHLIAGHMNVFLFLKLFAKIRFNVFVCLWKGSAKNKNDKSRKSQIFRVS